jgi:Predicted membrane protein
MHCNMDSRIVFNPFTIIMLILLVGLFLVVLPLLFLSLIGGAFVKLGFTYREVIILLFFTLVGSFINIPLTTITGEPVTLRDPTPSLFGMLYRIREVTPTTQVAINVGGALIPVFISLYLLYEAYTMLQPVILPLALIGVLIVSLFVKQVARPVRGLGIVTPFFVPPLAALASGLLLSAFTAEPVAAAIIAYVSGTLGTLIGADILNLPRIRELASPMVSIGGAGTFDGVFLTGIIAAFLA